MWKELEESDMMSLYDNFITRKDGINHLLLSDVNNLMEKVARDFPDIAKMTSIGKSYQGRDINAIEIDVPNPDV